MEICSSYCQGKSYEHPIWTTKSAVPLADVVWQCDQRSSLKMNFFLIKISSKSHKLHCLHLKIKLCDVNNIFHFKENVTFGNKMALTPGKVLLPVNRSCKFQVSTPLQLRVKMKHPDKVSDSELRGFESSLAEQQRKPNTSHQSDQPMTPLAIKTIKTVIRASLAQSQQMSL